MPKKRPAIIDLILRWRPRPGEMVDLDVILECPKAITPPNDWIADQLCRLAAKMRTKEDKSYITIQPKGEEPGFLETDGELGAVEIRDFASFLQGGDTLNLLMRATMEEAWSIAGPDIEFHIKHKDRRIKETTTISDALERAQAGRDKFFEDKKSSESIERLKNNLKAIT